jgi:hypothetical protein
MRLLLWALDNPVRAILGAALLIVVVVWLFSVRGTPENANAAVKSYLVGKGAASNVAVRCTKTERRERDHAVYACSIESDGVEASGLLGRCYVVDGKDASPAIGRC